MKQDGWGRRRHERSRSFCRLLGWEAHKSFRKNSDSRAFIVPGMPGLSDGYHQLAALIGDCGPVYGLQTQQHTLKLTERLFNEGVGSWHDVVRARALVEGIPRLGFPLWKGR